MEIYLEVWEVPKVYGEITKEPFVKKVASEKEAEVLFDTIKSEWAGKNYIAFIHYCTHDEKVLKPCSIKILKEV